jgi:hypothetical protein
MGVGEVGLVDSPSPPPSLVRATDSHMNECVGERRVGGTEGYLSSR